MGSSRACRFAFGCLGFQKITTLSETGSQPHEAPERKVGFLERTALKFERPMSKPLTQQNLNLNPLFQWMSKVGTMGTVVGSLTLV